MSAITYNYLDGYDYLYKQQVFWGYTAYELYEIPIYALMQPYNMALVIPEPTLFSPHPTYSFDSNQDLKTLLTAIILNYGKFKEQGFIYSEQEIETIKYMLSNQVDSIDESDNVVLLQVLYKALNGNNLSETDFSILTKHINLKLPRVSGETSFQPRLKGLLYYDYVLSLSMQDVKYKVKDFLYLFSDILQIKKRKFPSEELKKQYRSYLQLASVCVTSGTIEPRRNRGKTLSFPKIKVAEYSSWYKEYYQKYKDYKA